METNINNILQSGENIVWQGVINRKVLAVNLIISLAVILTIGGLFFLKETIPYTSNGKPAGEVSGAVVGDVIIGIGVVFSLLSFFQNLVRAYAVTQKRVIVKSGLIGTDYQSVYFEQIKEVLVDVGLIGKIFGVGTVKIDTGKTETYSTSSTGSHGENVQQVQTRTMYTYLSNIDTPYDVYKYVNDAVTGRKESLYSGRADQQNIQQSKV